MNLSASVYALQIRRDYRTRIYKVFALYGIETIGQLVSHTEAELLAYRNFGKASLFEVREALLPYNLTFGTIIKP